MPRDLPTPRLLVDGLTMVESARWHDGRLWFAHWGDGEVVAVDMDGGTEVMAEGPPGMGWSIDWLPDGRLLTTGPEVRRHEGDGSSVQHCAQGGNEIVVDGAGRVYVNGADFDFLGGAAPVPGYINLIDGDGGVRQVAGDIEFPNGMVITPDGSTLVIAESFEGRLTAFDIAPDGSLSGRRVWAEGLGPDGICIDAEGAIWAQSAEVSSGGEGACVRVLDGGVVTDRVGTELPCFACALGGPEGRSLFLLCNEWEGIDRTDEVLARRSSKIYVTEVEVPAAAT